MLAWVSENELTVTLLFIASLVMFFGTLLVLPILVVRMPADYFLHRHAPPDSWRGRHPAIRWSVLVVKNLVGAVLLAAGLIMLLTPGQGILAIIVGISMMDIPGKRQMELWLVRNRHVIKAINWIRTKHHRPPLMLPPKMERAHASN